MNPVVTIPVYLEVPWGATRRLQPALLTWDTSEYSSPEIASRAGALTIRVLAGQPGRLRRLQIDLDHTRAHTSDHTGNARFRHRATHSGPADSVTRQKEQT